MMTKTILTCALLANTWGLTWAGINTDFDLQKRESLVMNNYRDKRIWDNTNNPVNIFKDKSLERNYSKLKSKNQLDTQPWSDSYWPNYQGGIAYRWQSQETPFGLNLTRAAYRKMNQVELKALSPAEKYDLFMGRYDVPTFNSEKARTSPSAAHWEGLCHGWAPAALLFSEPKPVTLTNPEGLKIPFGASDIKALLIYYTAFTDSKEQYPTELYAGNRCYYENSNNCANTNAGAFHLIITNMINRKIPMIADIDRGIEVWNQPIAGYEIIYQVQRNRIGRLAAPGTVREITVAMKMKYAQEVSQKWDSGLNIVKDVTYKYILELDRKDNIIGGEWISEERPDFIWTMSEPKFSDEYYSGIKTIYTKSISRDNIENKEIKSLDGISVGDQVLETYYTSSIVTVKAISSGGYYYLTGGDEGSAGDWYSRKNIQKLVESYDGVTRNTKVVETFESKSLTLVKYISENGLYYLTGGDEGIGGDWYSRENVKNLVNTYDSFSVGEKVFETYLLKSLVEIKYISEDGHFYVTGGDAGTAGFWYPAKYLKKR